MATPRSSLVGSSRRCCGLVFFKTATAAGLIFLTCYLPCRSVCDLEGVDSDRDDPLFAAIPIADFVVWPGAPDVGDALHLDGRAAGAVKFPEIVSGNRSIPP